MILFSEEAIGCIHRAAIINANNIDEKFYLFLKKLTQVPTFYFFFHLYKPQPYLYLR